MWMNNNAIVTAGKLRAFGTVDDVMGQLCPQRNYEVQLVHETDLTRASNILASKLADAEPITLSQKERVLRFPTVRSELELAGILQSLVESKIPVAQYREVASDLEDAFLSVANQE
jgi:ABC-2 type transport system ATP-binding protein